MAFDRSAFLGSSLSSLGAGLMAAGAGGDFGQGMMQGQQQFQGQISAQQQQQAREFQMKLAQEQAEQQRLENTRKAAALKAQQDYIARFGPQGGGQVASQPAGQPGSQVNLGPGPMVQTAAGPMAGGGLPPGPMAGGGMPQLTQQQAEFLSVFPDQAQNVIADKLWPETPELKAAPSRQIGDGQGHLIDQEMQPDGTWQTVGSRPQFAPQQPQQGPADPERVRLARAGGLVEGTPEFNAFVLGSGSTTGKAGDLPESLKFYTEKTKPYIDAASDTRRQGATIETALAQGDGTGDIAAITSFNKLLDPGAVVREADVTLTLSAQGLADQLAVWVQNKKEGDILPPTLRTRMRSMARKIVDTNLGYSKERIQGFKQGAQKYGVDWTDILPPNVETQLFNPPPLPSNEPATPDPGFTGPNVPQPDVTEGTTIVNQQTGERKKMQGGVWVPVP